MLDDNNYIKTLRTIAFIVRLSGRIILFETRSRDDRVPLTDDNNYIKTLRTIAFIIRLSGRIILFETRSRSDGVP